jgi:hypothetical protein
MTEEEDVEAAAEELEELEELEEVEEIEEVEVVEETAVWEDISRAFDAATPTRSSFRMDLYC